MAAVGSTNTPAVASVAALTAVLQVVHVVLGIVAADIAPVDIAAADSAAANIVAAAAHYLPPVTISHA